MTKVFVHGNPETTAIWGPLIDALKGWGFSDFVTVSPPGFGAPVPPGFSATPAGYVEWLAGEVRALPGPIDLVGHDWGAGHVYGLAAAYPELIRSWVCDIGGVLHPDYVWHDMAQVWQTPGAGEEAVAAMASAPVDERAAMLQSLGLTREIASDLAAAADETMGQCILDLYRAGAQPALVDLANRLASAPARSAMILNPELDAYVPAALAAEPATRMGAALVDLPGQGHWWMVENPVPGADAIARFWSNLA